MKFLLYILFFISLSNLELKSDTNGWDYITNVSKLKSSAAAFFSNGEELYIVNRFEQDIQVLLSSDNGKTWKVKNSIFTSVELGNLLNTNEAVLVDKDFIYCIFYNKKAILKFTNKGEDYKLIEFENGVPFYRIAMFNRNIGIALTNYEVYVTYDGWETYKSRSVYSGSRYSPNFIDDNNVEFYVSNKSFGFIVNFNLETMEWTRKYEFPENDDVLLDFTYLDNGNGFICGLRRNGNGDRATDILFQSNDNGQSWTKKIDQDVEPQWGLDDIAFNDTNNGFIFGQLGKIVMTNNGGQTWDYVDSLNFYSGLDTLYGPFAARTLWLDNKPYILSLNNELYTYNGDYFDYYNRYSIEGNYTESGYPVYGRLQAGNKVKYNYDNGKYEFENLTPGIYTVVPTKTDFFSIVPDSITVLLDNQNKENINFELIRKKYDLNIELSNPSKIELENIAFQISYTIEEGKPRSFDTIVSFEGLNSYLLEDVYANRNLKIKPIYQNDNYKILPSEYNIELVRDTSLQFEALINKSGFYSVRGHFRRDGKGLYGVKIYLVGNTTLLGIQYTFTDEEGNYIFNNLMEGDYSVLTTSIDMNDFYISPTHHRISLDSNIENIDFNLSLASFIRIYGKVVDKNGVGVPDVNIHPFEHSNPNSLIKIFQGVRTKEDGTYISHFFEKNPGSEFSFFTEFRDISTPESYTLDISENYYNKDFVLDMEVSDVPSYGYDDLLLYPNPADERISIDIPKELKGLTDIFILDTRGRILITKYGIINRNIELDVSELPQGFYTVKITNKHLQSLYKTLIIK